MNTLKKIRTKLIKDIATESASKVFSLFWNERSKHYMIFVADVADMIKKTDGDSLAELIAEVGERFGSLWYNDTYMTSYGGKWAAYARDYAILDGDGGIGKGETPHQAVRDLIFKLKNKV